MTDEVRERVARLQTAELVELIDVPVIVSGGLDSAVLFIDSFGNVRVAVSNDSSVFLITSW